MTPRKAKRVLTPGSGGDPYKAKKSHRKVGRPKTSCSILAKPKRTGYKSRANDEDIERALKLVSLPNYKIGPTFLGLELIL